MKISVPLFFAAISITTSIHAATIAAKIIKVDGPQSILIRLSDEKYDKKCDGDEHSRFGVVQVVDNYTAAPLRTFKACYLNLNNDELYILFWDEVRGDGSSLTMSKKSFDKTEYFKGWGEREKS
ncbi:hypothetical protein RC79_08860 [Pectobacterium brasiliense]|uniref:hypothetical protein n=1 Tax=Pectobacterium brasiliense TaxID=180957 RepID=UPI00057D7DDA|nr:hypothetical protein [Pectobacterium brasiliense]KHS74325.1 hypothetical protein RC79_08860 [Pectobacterium brasiliense]